MRSNLQLYHRMLGEIQQRLKGERVTRQRNLALLVVGLYLAQSVYLSKIGGQLPVAAKKWSLADRLRRFLRNKAVRVVGYYDPLLVPLLRVLADKVVLLIMDVTQVGPWHRALVLGLSYRGRTLPLAWSVHEGTRGNVAVTAQITLLERVYQRLPLGTTVTLLADSGFDSTDVLRWLDDHEWQFVIRQKKRVTVRPVGQRDWFALREVPLAEGETKVLGWTFLSKTSPFGPVWVVLHWKEGEEDPWLLAASEGDTRRTLRLYGKRSRIEAMYSDMKSRGFDLEKTRLEQPQRIERLMLGIAIAYLWFVALGSWVVKNSRRHQIDRPDRRDLGYFRLGWDWLNDRLRLGLSFHLRFLPYYL